MNASIRILGIVTSIIWVLLIVVVVFTAYSLKDFGFGLYRPIATVGQSGGVILPMSVIVNNTGVTDLNSVKVTSVFRDANGSEVSYVSSLVSVVRQRENATVTQNLTVNSDALAKEDGQFLFKDSNCTISVGVSSTFGGLLPAELSVNVSYLWGAPFFNFTLGKPTVAAFNDTHASVTIPLSFENHAPFALTGNVKVDVYDQNGALQGKSQTGFIVQAFSRFNNSLEFYSSSSADLVSALSKGHFVVHLSSALCDYGPWVIMYG